LAVSDPSHTFLAGTTILRSGNTKKLNCWVSSQQAWLPQGAWDACRSSREFTPGKRGVVLGFDGSKTQDTTCLVAVTCDLEPQVIVLGLWARPFDADADWEVPRGEVMDAIRHACHEYHVREVACDEYIWTSELNELEAEGIPIVVFPQTLTRMAPATQKFYEKVANRKISHDGNPNLAKHLDNAYLKSDSRGARLMKDSKNSRRKIDLAMAAVMAVDRADFWANEPLEGSINGIPVADVQFVWSDGDAGGRVSPGEECCLCGNKVVKHLDGSPRLVRIGLQVVCNPPCGGTRQIPDKPEATEEPPTVIW
jgi:phage terminase large subunit-like protein